MDMKLEVLVVPVSDVDRAKRFYMNLGFRLDADYVANHDFRVVQLTPPGSECSVIGPTTTVVMPEMDIPLTVNPLSVLTADFNGDGKMDLALVSFSNSTVTILLGNGDGT